MAVKASSIYLATLGFMFINQSVFMNEISNDGVISVSIVFTVLFNNIYMEVLLIIRNFVLYLYNFKKNITTISGCLVLTNDVYGVIRNLTIKNHHTTYGPTLTFVSLSSFFLCDNITISSDDFNTIYQGKVGVSWNSSVNFTNFDISNFQGRGFFDIQYHSQINFDQINFTNFTFWNDGKGCILFIDSMSIVNLSNFRLEQIISKNSLVFIDNSNLTIISIDLFSLQLSNETTDAYFFWIDSAYVEIDDLETTSHYMCFAFQQNAYVTIKNSIFDNDQDNSMFLALYYAYYPTQITIINTIFINQKWKQSVIILFYIIIKSGVYRFFYFKVNLL